jgi:hypothetical protein
MKKALLIGINYYDISNITLNGCINDIININNMLIDAYDYAIDNITILRDHQSNPNYYPTRKNILNLLTKLINESSTLDEVWIHYSGHGSRVPGKYRDTNQDDGYDEVLVPIDYETEGFIIDEDLFNIIKNTKCRTIIIIDCCHSATMFDLPWSFEYDINSQELNKIKNNMEVLNNKQVFMFSGCKDKQTSSDIFNRETEQYSGAFTNAFMYCLRKKRHNVSYLQLYKDIFNYLIDKGYSQRPVFSCSSENPEGVLLRSGVSVEPLNIRSIIRQNMRTLITK